LSKAIGTTTVIEGVETKEQVEHLRGLGCTTAQGYYFARPMPAGALTEILASSEQIDVGLRPMQKTKAKAARRSA
ncbi:MAG TPA: EAL domain-containing protein, partial [Acidimicrobiales bacterium]|nr:EAL domain-containing protein [Acidimicrobiales bacterium]